MHVSNTKNNRARSVQARLWRGEDVSAIGQIGEHYPLGQEQFDVHYQLNNTAVNNCLDLNRRNKYIYQESSTGQSVL